MKRFIAIFGIFIIITMHCLSFYPAKAAITAVDYGEMLNTYLGAAETALAASQGVTIDWSNLELPAGSDTWTDHQKAEYVVSSIGNIKKVGEHAIYEWLFGPDNDTQDVISAQTAAIVLAKNSNIDTQDIKAQLDNILATQSQEHIFQKYTDKVIARWNEYNTNYINDYLDLFNTENDIEFSNVPITSNINEYVFDWPYSVYTSRVGLDYSFTYANTTVYAKYPAVLGYINENFGIVVGDNLTSSGSYVSQNVTNFTGDISTFRNIYQSNAIMIFPNAYYTDNDGLHITQAVLNYLQSGSYGVVIDNPFSFSLPDAVIDNSSEDGKIVAHPIYYPDTMNTDKAIDIDLDKVIDAIASRIAQGADDITFDDLVDAGATVKLDGNTLTNADTVVKDVSVPIARARVDTINGVVPTIDVVPPLPPLPPLNPGDYSGEGFSGMSVLARIINTTVQSLPAPIILTFFGVVFGAVILGIIKILHK